MPEFQHNDVTYLTIPTSEWDFRDALFAKAVSGGMSVVEIETKVQQLDPDATIAFLAVPIHRVRDTADPARLRQELENNGMTLMQIVEALTRDEVGTVEDAASPPTVDGEPSGE